MGVVEKLNTINELLKTQAERSEGLEKCRQRALELTEQIERWREGMDDSYVRWIEIFSHTLQLNATPLSIAEIFHKQMSDHLRAWIFTSATLSVGGDFSHYSNEMGWEAQTANWDSPFDFRARRCSTPRGLPDRIRAEILGR